MLALVRRRPAAWLAAACLGVFGSGCANLEVKKVPLDRRAANTDHQQGFRYYLNRPYIVVKKSITIVENRCLVRVIPQAGSVPASRADQTKDGIGPRSRASADATDPGEVCLAFLTGPRQGQTVRLADLRVGTPGTGSVRQVSPAELQKIAMALDAEPAPAGPALGAPGAEQVALGDGQVINDVSGMSMTSGAGATLSGTGTDGGGGATGSSDASSGGGELQQPTLATVQHTPPLTGDIGILYLPDLDEQYVIKSCSFVSKTAFGLAFRNGSELTEVQGDHDSTALPLAILQQIQKAIGTAQGVEQQRIQQQSKSLKGTQGAGGVAGGRVGPEGVDQIVWQLIERTSIKPGVYRLNKPWEMEGTESAQPQGCGLLAKLGLPTVVELDFKAAGTIGK